MKRKTKWRKKSKRNISEPFPVTECVDYQRLFSFPLPTNHGTVADINNNFGNTVSFFKSLQRRKSLPANFIRKKPTLLFRGLDPVYDNRKNFQPREENVLLTPSTESQISTHSECWNRNPDDASLQSVSLLTTSLPEKPPRRSERKQFTCQNKDCSKTEVLLGRIQMEFKSCKYCFTHYCSVKCNLHSYHGHLNICYYGKINYYLNKTESILREDEKYNHHYYQYSWNGYKTSDRGCLFLVFLSPQNLFDFIDHEKHVKPSYSSSVKILKTTTNSEYQRNILKVVSGYDPLKEFLINVAVVVDKVIPLEPLPRLRDKCLKRLLVIPITSPAVSTSGILFSELAAKHEDLVQSRNTNKTVKLSRKYSRSETL
ncbi:uncharacterized protein LOC130613103 [Hydractinia symbiolongicarpus]|uniref:uncharacterized protein LOC130613103 n=1 Tax=Hydractinia symbiolongicarpus TaxID=13093 RepID=UPI00254D6DDC|nr:uncharacterized protein LOC130613103 [Hydractinia symbiolongicarpus]